MKSFNIIFSINSLFAIWYLTGVVALYGLSDHDRNQQNYIELNKFLNRYSCSQEVETQLSASNLSEDMRTLDGRFYLKDNISRLVNTIRLQRFIQNNEISGITLPKKCWSKRLHVVVCSTVPHITATDLQESGRKLTLQEVQKIAKIIEATAFNDLNYPNVSLTLDDKLCFIDLEDKSFFANSRFAGVRRGLEKLLGWPMQLDAHEWLNKKFNEIQKTEEAKDWAERVQASLAFNRQYDDKDIDFNKVKIAARGSIG